MVEAALSVFLLLLGLQGCYHLIAKTRPGASGLA